MTYNSEVLSDTPVLYLKMDEVSGTIADSSTANRTVTANNGPTQNVAGVSGRGISFDGVNDYLTANSVTDFHSATNYTVEVWFKTTQSSGFPTFMRRDGGGGAVLLRLNNGKVEFYANNPTNALTTAATYANGVWHHAVGVRTGTTTKLYVDGTQVASGTATNLTQTTTPPVYIGAGGVGAELFTGTLDELAIYTTALSSTRITAHYNAGVAAQIVSITNQPPAMTASLTAPVPLVDPNKGAVRATPPAMTMSLLAPVPAVRIPRTVTVPAMILSLAGTSATVTTTTNYVYTASADRGKTSNAEVNAGRIAFNSQSGGNYDIAYFKFDVAAVPTGYQISSATLSFTPGFYASSNGLTIGYTIQRLTAAWTEGVYATPAFVTTGQVADFMTIGTRRNVDITAIATAWLGGATNNGVRFLANTSGTAGTALTDIQDRTTGASAPTLTIAVVPIPPTPVTVTGPPMTASLAAVDATATAYRNINVAAPAMPLTLATPNATVYGSTVISTSTTAPVMNESITFTGGTSKNPDYRMLPQPITLDMSSVTPVVAVRYAQRSIVSGAMELSLSTVAANISLTTNRLSKVNGAMLMTGKLVGIYAKETDRYYNYVPQTVDADDVWYEMEETSGNVAADSIYQTNDIWKQNGTYNGSPTFAVDGPQLRKAVHFDGVDDWLRVGPYRSTSVLNSANDLNDTMSITIEFSIKTSQQNGVVFQGTGGRSQERANVVFNALSNPYYSGYEVRLENGQMVLQCGEGGLTVRVRKSIADGQWHHIVMSIPSASDINNSYVNGYLDKVAQSFVAVDGKVELSRSGLFQNQSYGGFWVPYAFMARATAGGRIANDNPSLSLSDNMTGFLAGDLRDVIVRLNKNVSAAVATKLYYEWSESLLVEPTPITVSLNTVAPFKARGNTRRMLALYGLAWDHNDATNLPTFTYFSNLSGFILEQLNRSNADLGALWPNVGQKSAIEFNVPVYYQPRPFQYEGYIVYGVSILGDFKSDQRGPRSAAGILSADAATDEFGQFIDDHTGLPRFINLQTDLAEPLENFDAITTVNYPWELPNQDKRNLTIQEPQDAHPSQLNLGLTDIEWAQARDVLRDSILEGAYNGIDLWISEYHAALHLGFIQGYDISAPGYFDISLNTHARQIDSAHLDGAQAGKFGNWSGNKGGYHSYPQANYYRRIVALEPGLTDIPSNEYGEIVEGWPVDEWEPNGHFFAWDIIRRPNGLQLGDQIKMSMYEYRPGHPQQVYEQYVRTAVISARPEGAVGKVIAREMDHYYGANGVVLDNPRKNNIITLAAERGSFVRGRPITGRAFIELMETDSYYAPPIQEDLDKNRWQGSPKTNPVSQWAFDSRRQFENKVINVTNRLNFDGSTNQFAFSTITSTYFQYGSGDYLYNKRVTMHARGLNWLAAGAQALPAGAVKVFAPGIELSLRIPAPTFTANRSVNVKAGSARMDLELRQPRNYRGADVRERAFPLVLELDVRGIGKQVKVPPMTLSLTAPDAVIAAGGDVITVYLDSDRNVIVFLKEDN